VGFLMLNFLLGYLVGSASSQPAVPAMPMSPEEAVGWALVMFVVVMLLLSVFVRGLKRGL